jgi:hypothetical protein
MCKESAINYVIGSYKHNMTLITMRLLKYIALKCNIYFIHLLSITMIRYLTKECRINQSKSDGVINDYCSITENR